MVRGSNIRTWRNKHCNASSYDTTHANGPRRRWRVDFGTDTRFELCFQVRRRALYSTLVQATRPFDTSLTRCTTTAATAVQSWPIFTPLVKGFNSSPPEYIFSREPDPPWDTRWDEIRTRYLCIEQCLTTTIRKTLLKDLDTKTTARMCQ